jgi:hypothetical protein
VSRGSTQYDNAGFRTVQRRDCTPQQRYTDRRRADEVIDVSAHPDRPHPSRMRPATDAEDRLARAVVVIQRRLILAVDLEFPSAFPDIAGRECLGQFNRSLQHRSPELSGVALDQYPIDTALVNEINPGRYAHG